MGDAVRFRPANSRRRARGSSFVEVLLAMAIMALVLVGILQMFSVSLVINKGSAARTQMLFRCQQVVENIRYFYYLNRNSAATPPIITDTGHVPSAAMAAPGTLPLPLSAVAKTFLPYTDPSPGSPCGCPWDYWGPLGANVMETSDGPYKIAYTIVQDPAQNVWVVTVSATPTDVASATRYFGVGLAGGKRVDYVAQFQ